MWVLPAHAAREYGDLRECFPAHPGPDSAKESLDATSITSRTVPEVITPDVDTSP
jgi:hypothetical protein